MITILDFVNAGAHLTTASGWDFKICYVEKDVDYPICGYVITPDGTKSMLKWDKDGNPEKLPTTHGLNLIPTVPITKYHMIDTRKMNTFDRVQDLINSEIQRMSSK